MNDENFNECFLRRDQIKINHPDLKCIHLKSEHLIEYILGEKEYGDL